MTRQTETTYWRQLTLPGQFLLAGAVVMIIAMSIVGNWVSRRIEDTVVQNSATAAASFMESFISPLGQELADNDTLSAPAKLALSEIFEGTTLGERVVSYKLWLPDGQVVHASDPSLAGQVFEPSEDLLKALNGEIGSSFEDLNDLENEAEAALGVPLLEVYSPIREVWTGRVIAVAEFYERADLLAADLGRAKRHSWLVVGGTFMASGLLLFGIVQAGGRTIRQQRGALENQLLETEKVSQQNEMLRRRAVSASSRATAQTERAIRRIGSDLHDGPAQYLALAALRLDTAFAATSTTGMDAANVRSSLDKALEELRIISRGLALPDLDHLGLFDLIKRAVTDHERQSGMSVDVELQAEEPKLNYAQKLCVFRFLQETLSNVVRHANTEGATVNCECSNSSVIITVSDQGAGFDTTQSRTVREDGGQGLYGLTDRAESIGGALIINSVPGQGSTFTLTLPKEDLGP